MANVSDLLGKTLKSVEEDRDCIVFKTVDGEVYHMYHAQDCCESVYVEDITGNLEDLVGSPLTIAEQADSDKDDPLNEDESYTWTFYKFATIKGYVTIRWYGSSNGYYSESVDFDLVSSKTGN